jgi:response regulator RpfG family c-di-GMP phosphodiesterase
MLREMVTELLISKGYSVLTAEDGVQGVEVYNRHKEEIALIMSDLGLPRSGGDELFLTLKSINPHVKFILASGFIDPNIKAKLSDQGLQHIVSKPYHPSHILTKIREVMDTP